MQDIFAPLNPISGSIQTDRPGSGDPLRNGNKQLVEYLRMAELPLIFY